MREKALFRQLWLVNESQRNLVHEIPVPLVFEPPCPWNPIFQRTRHAQAPFPPPIHPPSTSQTKREGRRNRIRQFCGSKDLSGASAIDLASNRLFLTVSVASNSRRKILPYRHPFEPNHLPAHPTLSPHAHGLAVTSAANCTPHPNPALPQFPHHIPIGLSRLGTRNRRNLRGSFDFTANPPNPRLAPRDQPTRVCLTGTFARCCCIQGRLVVPSSRLASAHDLTRIAIWVYSIP